MESRSDVYREALLVLGCLMALLILTHSGFDNSEANYHYLISQQIIRHGQLSLPSDQEGPFIVAPDGLTYAAHELGNSVVLIPVALLNEVIERYCGPTLGIAKTAVFTRFLFAMMGPVICSITSAFLFLTLRLVFGQTARAATVNVLLFVFCSFYWTYARSIFDGVLCSALISATMFFLFSYGRRSNRPGFLIGAFLCMGFGLITRLSMGLLVITALVYLWSILKNRDGFQIKRAAAIAITTLTPFVIWQLYYNHLRTGGFLTSPGLTAKYASEIGLTGNVLVGLSGLLFSPGKSIFVYCPAALLSILLLRRFWLRYSREALFASLLGLLWLGLHAKLHSWYGSWGWGPRHFITIVPVMVLPFLVMRSQVRSRAFRACTLVMLSFGFLLGIASIITNYHYRLGLAMEQHRLTDNSLVWSLRDNQAADVLSAATRNLKRMTFGGTYEVLPHASEIDVAGSNTINILLVTAHRMGVPASALASVALALLSFSGGALWMLLRSPRTRCHS